MKRVVIAASMIFLVLFAACTTEVIEIQNDSQPILPQAIVELNYWYQAFSDPDWQSITIYAFIENTGQVHIDYFEAYSVTVVVGGDLFNDTTRGNDLRVDEKRAIVFHHGTRRQETVDVYFLEPYLELW